MKKGQHRIFKDPETIKDIIYLRQIGWGYKGIALKYNCDHSSVVYQIHKYEDEQQRLLDCLPVEYNQPRILTKKQCPVCEMLLTSKTHMANPCVSK